MERETTVREAAGRETTVRRAGPNKYTAAVVSAIQTALGQGCNRKAAAEAAGIDRSTLYGWLNDPERLTFGYRIVQEEGPEGEPKTFQVPEPVTTFREMVIRTQAMGENRYIAVIEQITKGGTLKRETTTARRDGSVVTVREYHTPQWEAAAWMLERTNPEAWGSKRRGPDFSHLTNQELLDLLAANNAEEDDAGAVGAITEGGGGTPKQLTGPGESSAGLDGA